jgi:hypothetical protein
MAVDFFAGSDREFFVESLDVRWEIQIGVDAHGVVLSGGHQVGMPGIA